MNMENRPKSRHLNPETEIRPQYSIDGGINRDNPDPKCKACDMISGCEMRLCHKRKTATEKKMEFAARFSGKNSLSFDEKRGE